MTGITKQHGFQLSIRKKNRQHGHRVIDRTFEGAGRNQLGDVWFGVVAAVYCKTSRSLPGGQTRRREIGQSLAGRVDDLRFQFRRIFIDASALVVIQWVHVITGSRSNFYFSAAETCA
ncbi:MAG: hypothetical protein DME26_01645 [Verrucomicrobia bacterium]|nr:MAG: hypothetical protein DME26_01645 [Verrucomicrobiota bacterium]